LTRRATGLTHSGPSAAGMNHFWPSQASPPQRFMMNAAPRLVAGRGVRTVTSLLAYRALTVTLVFLFTVSWGRMSSRYPDGVKNTAMIR